MIQKFNKLFYLQFFTLLACSDPPSIAGFERDRWTNDPLACKMERLKYRDILQENRELLLRLSQNEIQEVLGSPDEHELDERKRKYYYYYLEPAKQCGGKSFPLRLQIKFNALGVSAEVFIENY